MCRRDRLSVFAESEQKSASRCGAGRYRHSNQYWQRSDAVSYTHLDVYKRQSWERLPDVASPTPATCHPGEESTIPRLPAWTYWPVSYTHLDVYKRQVKEAGSRACPGTIPTL